MSEGRILLIEDDRTIVYGLKELLEEEGFEVTAAGTLGEAEKAAGGDYCLALLDLGLPDGEGWRFIEEISEKKRGNEDCHEGTKAMKAIPPVIILTARDGEEDIIRGLDMGADDYVTKPFRAGILLSRIRAVLRRQERFRGEEEPLTCGDIALDRKRTIAMAGQEKIDLTAGEYRLLKYFLENKNRTLTRNALLARLWDSEGDYVNDNTLTVTIKRLREKLGEKSRRLIKTVRGIGYRMEDCGEGE